MTARASKIAQSSVAQANDTGDARHLRVAYFVESFPVLSETFVLNEVRALRRRGCQITVFAMYPPEAMPQHPGAQEEAERAVYLEARLQRMTGVSWRLRQLVDGDARDIRRRGAALGPRYRWLARHAYVLGDHLKQGEYDLIHGHFAAPAGEWIYLAAQMTGLPYTFTAHRRDVFDTPPMAFPQIAESAKEVITVSNYNRSYLAERFGIAQDHIRVVPCGIDTDWFFPEKAPPRDDTIPRIATVARLAPEKGLSYLLEAYATLRDRGTRFRATVAGEGPERSALLSLRSNLGLDDCVEFVGALGASGVRDLLQGSDLFALSSLSESLGVVYLEAMACGLPVVGTDVLGVGETICHEETGYLVEPRDPAAMADALERLVNDPELRKAMGKRSFSWVTERFSLERQVDDLLRVWRA